MLVVNKQRTFKENIGSLLIEKKVILITSIIDILAIVAILIPIFIMYLSYVSLPNEIKLDTNFSDYLCQYSDSKIHMNKELYADLVMAVSFSAVILVINWIILLINKIVMIVSLETYFSINNYDKNIFVLATLSYIFGFFVNFILYKKSKEIIENLKKSQMKNFNINLNYCSNVIIDDVQTPQITPNDLDILNLKRKLLNLQKMKELGLINDKEYYEIKEKIFLNKD